jgi:hypothetical protein
VIKEGERVRLLVAAQGLDGTAVPAGTVGTVVDDLNAPDEYAIDVVVDGRYDNVAVGGDEIEPLDLAPGA